MPVRALGAPHTTCTGSPVPVSTMQTRSRSALGCCSAEITRAMVKGASSFALSSTLSTSSPIMVSLSASAATDASVSRCSLSQERVTFIEEPSNNTCTGSRVVCSSAQPSRQCRKIEWPEAVVREPASVGLEQRALVRHAVLEHRDAIDPESPGEALVLIRIEPAVAHHVRMHHAAAENLDP